MSVKATPGPWLITKSHRGIPHILGAALHNGGLIGRCDGINQDANATLIVAAPDLLSALQRLMEESCPFVVDVDSCECGLNGNGVDDDGNVCEHIQAYRAIAKATGG